MAKPTLEKIQKDIEYTKKYYEGAHSEFDTDFKYLTCDFQVDVPIDIKRKVYPPSGQIALDTAKQHVPTTNPRVDVPVAGAGERGQTHADMLQKFYIGLLYRTTVESMTSPFDTMVENLFMCNMGVLKILYRPLRTEGMDADMIEMQKRLWLPIVISAVHPRNFYPDPAAQPEYTIEMYKRPAIEIEHKYPRWERGKKDQQEVEWVEWYDRKYRCCLADGRPVLKTEIEVHNYGFIPYSWGFANYGLQTADGDISYKTQGLLRPLRSMLEEEAYLWSVNHEINKMTAWPTTYLIGAEQMISPQSQDPLTTLDKRPGKMIPLPSGVTIKTDEMGKPAQAVLTELQMVRQEILDKVAPASMRGLAESGVRSGYDRSLMAMEASRRYNPAAIAAGIITSRILGHAARLLETKVPSEGITVWGKEPEKGEFEETIKGEDVKGHYLCYVEFSLANVEDEYRRANTGVLGLERGVLSRNRTRERYFGIVDPIGEEVQVQADRLVDGLMPVAAQLLQQELQKELMAEQVKGGVIPTAPPVQPAQPGMGMGQGGARPQGGVRPLEQRALPQSPTGAPFKPEEPKPFSIEEQKRILIQELGKRRLKQE